MAIFRISSFWGFLFLLAALSSFTIVTLAEKENSKSSEEQQHTDVAKTDDSSSHEDSKEKRSQEEIMFGNQQNSPNGLVDDLMSMSESSEDSSNGSQVQDSKSDESSDEGNQAPPAAQDDGQNDMMMQSGISDWDKIAAGYQDTIPMVDLVNSLYDQKEAYQPIRQRLERPIPLRKRSLRSSLGQMIQKRGIRLPRRSMRLKRQVDVEDLLNLFENERFYNEEPQVTPHIFSGRARTVAKRHVPGRYSSYPETPEFRYPYVFQHRDNGILQPSVPDMEEAAMDNDIDDLLLLPPNSRYIDAPQEPLELLPYGRQDDKNEGVQRWLNRHTVPSVFRVSKRSFYPIDYRFIPASGFKKRSSSGNGHVVGRYLDEETDPGDFGKWGHVVQVPEAYASPEDIARLYGLANLLSEGDEVRKRRSA